jgi:hypothetical protein
MLDQDLGGLLIRLDIAMDTRVLLAWSAERREHELDLYLHSHRYDGSVSP